MFYIQLIGILAFLILVLSFYKKNPKTILTYQIASNFAYTVHYFLLGALSGAFISFVGIFRNIAFINIKKRKELLTIIVIIIYVVITLVFYEGIYSFLPLIANSSYLISMTHNKKKSLLIGALISSTCWMIYGVYVVSYACMITEFIMIISNSIQLIKLIKKSR